jgi:nucleoside-diphosphate-sugar epimerase
VKEPKRILVTGGSGFLGAHLCERLLARGEEVVCADNLFTPELRTQPERYGPTIASLERFVGG